MIVMYEDLLGVCGEVRVGLGTGRQIARGKRHGGRSPYRHKLLAPAKFELAKIDTISLVHTGLSSNI